MSLGEFVIYDFLSVWPDVLVSNHYKTSSKNSVVRFLVNI